MKLIAIQLICSTVCTLCFTVMVTDISAQQPPLFGGQGIRTPFAESEPEPETKPGLHWPKLMDFSTENSKNEKPFRMFAPFSGSNTDSTDESDTADRPKLFGNMPALFPQRDPSEPNLIERMNAKSKDFVDRTTGWAQKKNQDFRERSFETWDSITKDLRPGASKSEGPDEPNLMSGAQPPVRTAENLDGRPSVRF